MIFNSIRWRLQLWYGVILVAVLAGFGVTAFQMERGRQMRRIDGELQRRINSLASALRPPPRGGGRAGDRPEAGAPPGRPRAPFPPQRPPFEEPLADRPPERDPQSPPRDFQLPAQLTSLFNDADTSGFYYVMWWRDGQEFARSANAPAHVPAVRRPLPGELSPASDTPARRRENRPEPQPARSRGEYREMALTTRPGEILLVGRSIATDLGELRLVAVRLAAVGGAILLLGLAGGGWLAGRALQPIDAISTAAAKISDGNLSQRINAADTESELGRLAGVLNSTFARLETAFAQQRQFTSDAAHELRTPLSVLLTQTQSALNRERSPAEYRETIEACQRAAQRMRRLIESLLELARLDSGHAPRKHEELNLAHVAADCVALIHALAAERRINILTELAPANFTGDANQIAIVITNLLTNAIQYNRDGGEVRITSRNENDQAMLTVTDNGPGIAAEHLPHIFDRFYRADSARTSTQGHSGLGLAISKALVEAHGGTIEVASQPGAGAIFTARFPMRE